MNYLLIILAFTLSLSVSANEKSKSKKTEKKLKEQLSLNADQDKKYAQLRQGVAEALIKEKTELTEARENFEKAMNDSKIDNDTLTKKYETYQQARYRYNKKRLEHVLKIRDTMSPEQRQKFKKLHGKFSDPHQEAGLGKLHE